jgi:hypothetical protein
MQAAVNAADNLHRQYSATKLNEKQNQKRQRPNRRVPHRGLTIDEAQAALQAQDQAVHGDLAVSANLPSQPRKRAPPTCSNCYPSVPYLP